MAQHSVGKGAAYLFILFSSSPSSFITFFFYAELELQKKKKKVSCSLTYM